MLLLLTSLTKFLNRYAFVAVFLVLFFFKFGVVNIAMGEAVPLIRLNTGNTTLDKGILTFYKCIQKEIKGSTCK